MTLSEIVQAQVMIERCRAKRYAARDPQGKLYYTLCLQGWEAWLAKVKAGAANSAA